MLDWKKSPIKEKWHHAFVDILLRSVIVLIIYMSLIYYLGLSKTINQIIRKTLKM